MISDWNDRHTYIKKRGPFPVLALESGILGDVFPSHFYYNFFSQRAFYSQKRKLKQNTHKPNSKGTAHQPYLTVLIDGHQALDGHVPDVASAEENLACGR